MSVYSMTGYASVQQTDATGGRVGLEIRSVNSRFLDLTFKLPEELRQHEPTLRELLQQRLKRGKVEVRVGIEAAALSAVREPQPAALHALHAAQETVLRVLPLATPLSVAEALRLAGEQSDGGTDWGAALPPLARQALGELTAAREREGARLCTMLRGHLTQLRTLAQQAKPLVPQLVAQQRARFLERWQEAMGLGAGGAGTQPLPEAAQDRALAEATAFAIRIDVAEELTRLAAHLDEIERLLTAGGEAGKRLDFLIQELHREANTLGSKSAALELTRISVDMKVLIEQMREQVQNIE